MTTAGFEGRARLASGSAPTSVGDRPTGSPSPAGRCASARTTATASCSTYRCLACAPAPWARPAAWCSSSDGSPLLLNFSDHEDVDDGAGAPAHAPVAWSTPGSGGGAATASCGRSSGGARDRRRHLLHPRTHAARASPLPATRRRVERRGHLALHLQPRRRRTPQGAVRVRRPGRRDGRPLPRDGAQRRRPGRLPRHGADPVPARAARRPPVGDGVRRRLRRPVGRPVRAVRRQRRRPPHHDPDVPRAVPGLAALAHRDARRRGCRRTGWSARSTR